MFLVRWALFLVLSAIVEVAGVTPVGPVEALAEAEEALHRPRAVRPTTSQTVLPGVMPAARVERSRASLRARQAARPSDAAAGAGVRKLPPAGRAASPSEDDH